MGVSGLCGEGTGALQGGRRKWEGQGPSETPTQGRTLLPVTPMRVGGYGWAGLAPAVAPPLTLTKACCPCRWF